MNATVIIETPVLSPEYRPKKKPSDVLSKEDIEANEDGNKELKRYFLACLEAYAKANTSLRECIAVCREAGVSDEELKEWAEEAGWALPTINSVMSQLRISSGERVRSVGGGRKVSPEKLTMVEQVKAYVLRHCGPESVPVTRTVLRELESDAKSEKTGGNNEA